MGSSSSSERAVSFEVIVNTGVFDRAPEELIGRAVRCALSNANEGLGEISVTLLGDREIQTMNRDYLLEDCPADVIAFSLGGDGRTTGDVYIGFDQAVRQSAEVGVSLNEELARLAIHGTLHVLGHDHVGGPDRIESQMFELQERLLAELLS